MKFDVTGQVGKLEDIPNIGKSIAADLRAGLAYGNHNSYSRRSHW